MYSNDKIDSATAERDDSVPQVSEEKPRAPLFKIVKLADDKAQVVLEQCCIR